MGFHDWIYYCVDNQITRSAAGYIVKVAESMSGTSVSSKPAQSLPPVAPAVVFKPLWQQSGHSHNFLRLAAISGSAAVCLGAYGAHRHWEVEDKYKDDIEHRKKQFEVANHYHFYHTLALIAVPLARFPLVSGALFTTGIILFCGPIYYSSVSGDKTYNRLTPFGGVSFIIAWLTLVL